MYEIMVKLAFVQKVPQNKKGRPKATFCVPRAGLEPARLHQPQDFKSCVSTDSTIGAQTCLLGKSSNKKAALQAALRGAENEVRTRDLNLGKVALYQLSYFRVSDCKGTNIF